MNIERIAPQDAAIVSGSDAPHDQYDSSSDDNEDYLHHDNGNNDPMSYHYNPAQDDEDEAYVYRHLRGGTEETVTIRTRNTTRKINQSSTSTSTHGTNHVGNREGGGVERKEGQSTQQVTTTSENYKMTNSNSSNEFLAHNNITSSNDDNAKKKFTVDQAKILKPRYSDAVLSCPCCLQIVCMDCQRHERYLNQYRAMFVMNIGVCWDKIVTPETTSSSSSSSSHGSSRKRRDLNRDRRSSTEMSLQQDQNISDDDSDYDDDDDKHYDDGDEDDEEQGVYYSVYCNNCMTEVAALNMKDEVYHFFGCVASA